MGEGTHNNKSRGGSVAMVNTSGPPARRAGGQDQEQNKEAGAGDQE